MIVDILLNTRFLLLDESITEYVSFPVISISKNAQFREEIFYDTLGVEELGTHEASSPFKKYAYGYLAVDLAFISDNDSREEKIVQLAKHTLIMQSWFNNFLFYLWFERDNSISSDFAYLRSKPIMFPSVNNIAHNRIDRFTCTCEQIESIFSEKELEYAFNLSEQVKVICPGNKNTAIKRDIKVEEIEDPSKLLFISDIEYHIYNRLERALLFLSAARSEMHLLSKISAYCSIFECLFSTEKTDIAYKISQRIALYIGNDYDERIYLKKLVADAYNIRSRYIHGNAISRNDLKEKGDFNKKNLLRISKEVDNLLRIVLTKIILADHEVFNDDEKLLVLFERLIFQE